MILSKSLAYCVRPLVAETGIEEVPHRVWASSFLVGLNRRCFLVTTRHGLRPYEDLSPLCVAGPKGRLFELIDVFYMPLEAYGEDHFDIAVIELNLQKLGRDLGETPILPLDHSERDWMSYREISPFRVLGFPNDHTYMDYDRGEVVEGLVTLEANYIGPAQSPWIHQLTVPNPPPLSTFSGFSGGPVFAISRSLGKPAVPVFAGMALQGSIQSRIVRFVVRERVEDMVRARITRG